ncbi:MAG: DUF4760 domain-containing protein [Methylocystis sp.]|nr:DUF4760 domain-containing protein [Methylocystis sp.]
MIQILDGLKSYGPGLSPIVIAISALVAYGAIRTQRDLARKRATLDFFIRTETDSVMLELWNNFAAGVTAFENAADKENFKSASPKEYESIRAYLNILELMACGICEKILDEQMCRNFFVNIVIEYFNKLENFIIILQKEHYCSITYCEFVKLARKWK